MVPSPSSGVKFIGDCSVAVMILAIYCSLVLRQFLAINVAAILAYECLHRQPTRSPRFLSALAARSADEALLLQQNGCSDVLSPPDLHECDRAPGRPMSRLA